MSLSKVYKSSDTFQPEGLVTDKLEPDKVRKKSVPPPERSGARVPPPPSRQQAPAAPQRQPQAETPPVTSPPERTNSAIGENATPAQPTPPAPPPPPAPDPGIPHDEVERMLAQARAEGVQEGMAKAEGDFGSAASSMLLICRQLEELRDTILKNSVGEIKDLVLAIAEKVIRHSVGEQKDTILRTVDEAIHKTVRSDEMYVFVNPDDYDFISEKATELVSGLSGLNNLIVKSDITVERGGCRIESDNCTVDASLLTQLDIIGQAIRKPE